MSTIEEAYELVKSRADELEKHLVGADDDPTDLSALCLIVGRIVGRKIASRSKGRNIVEISSDMSDGLRAAHQIMSAEAARIVAKAIAR